MKKNNFFIKFMVFILVGVIGFEMVIPTISYSATGDYAEITSTRGEAGVDEDLSKDMASSKVLDYVAKFIFALARIVENLVTIFSKTFFGVDQYPWGDLIVFNTIPYLDVNFINPAVGSIFYESDGSANNFTTLGAMVRGVYYTLLVLAAGLLGLGVAITAIRLAISSIAADKAKYKEALVRCLYTVVMLFSLHFLLSFIFYANETIVNMAAKMLTTSLDSDDLKKLNDKLNEVTDNEFNAVVGYYKEQGKENFGLGQLGENIGDGLNRAGNSIYESYSQGFENASEGWEEGWGIFKPFTAVGGYVYGRVKGGVEGAQEDTYRDQLKKEAEEYWKVSGMPTSGDRNSKDYDPISVQIFNYLHNNPDFNGAVNSKEKFLFMNTADEQSGLASGFIPGALQFTGRFLDPSYSSGTGMRNVKNWSDVVYLIRNGSSESYIKNSLKSTLNDKAANIGVDAYKRFVANEGSNSVPMIFSNLGDWFKSKVYSRDSKNREKADLIAAMIYAIFVVQSLMLLFSYIKRIFYVILLSLLGPVIVIYDFLLGSF